MKFRKLSSYYDDFLNLAQPPVTTWPRWWLDKSSILLRATEYPYKLCTKFLTEGSQLVNELRKKQAEP